MDKRSSTSHQTGRRVTPRQAADQLGVSVEAIRGRIKRGTLAHVKEGGAVYVLLPVDQITTGRNQSSDQSSLVAALEDRIEDLRARLDREQEARTEERRRHDHIIAGLVNRVPELSAPASTDEAQGAAQDAEPSSGRGDVPREPETASSRRWWKRIFR